MQSGRETDVLVIGAGPAGAAAAISAAQKGLIVTIAERLPFPRHRAGETLHPGAEVLFDQLGVEEEVAAATPYRHGGTVVAWDGSPAYQRFGGPARGKWRGYLIPGSKLDEVMLRRVRAVGAEILQPCAVGSMASNLPGSIVEVDTSCGPIACSVVVDATGAGHWSRQHRNVRRVVVSPLLRAYYGYSSIDASQPFQDPCLESGAAGWHWTARIEPEVMHWMRLAYPGAGAEAREPPTSCAGGAPAAPRRGADVSWALHWPVADPGVFAVGDAAMTVDPLSSGGVLRALLTGIAAGHLAHRVCTGVATRSFVADRYAQWVRDQFETECHALLDLYERVSAGWTSTARERLARFDALLPSSSE